MLIARVREIDCDGGQLGRTWSERFFTSIWDAETYADQLRQTSDSKNPKQLFSEEIEEIEGLYGYCNWCYGTLITVDRIFIDLK